MKKLLPCPFCGSENVYPMKREYRTEIQCGSCFARGGAHGIAGHAVNRWNKRYNPEKEQEKKPMTTSERQQQAIEYLRIALARCEQEHIPMSAYVVMGTTGEYGGRLDWPVVAYFDETQAERHMQAAARRGKEIYDACADNELFSPNPRTDNEYDASMMLRAGGTMYYVMQTRVAKP